MIQILHNPRCSKSRCALDYLKQAQLQFEVLDYLENPLSAEELKALLKKLGIAAKDLIRTSEALYKEKFAGKEFTEEEWLSIMESYPKLIERPIVIQGDKAVIGRPIEKVHVLLEEEGNTKGT